MEKQKKVLEEIAFVTGMKMLAQAYEEIATIKMRQSRDSVLTNRDFLTALTQVFLNVKSSYRKKLLQAQQHKTFSELIHFAHLDRNGKEVIVFFSATNKLYGDIIPRIFSEFTKAVENNPLDDIAIVGESGREMFVASGIKREYGYFPLPDALTSYEMLKPLVSFLTKYERVKAFYGRFSNVLSQNVMGEYITEGFASAAVLKESADNQQDFYFEPSVEQILQFFETQVFAILLQQTIHETELARLASRIRAMEQVIEQTNERIGVLNKISIHNKHDINNKKQLEQMIKIYYYNNR